MNKVLFLLFLYNYMIILNNPKSNFTLSVLIYELTLNRTQKRRVR